MKLDKITPYDSKDCESIILGYGEGVIQILEKYHVCEKDVDKILDYIEKIQILVSDMMKDKLPILKNEKIKSLRQENEKLENEMDVLKRQLALKNIAIEVRNKREMEHIKKSEIYESLGMHITTYLRFEKGGRVKNETVEAILNELGFTRNQIENMMEDLR